MWALVGLLIFLILLQIVEGRYKRLQQQDPRGFEQAIAVGQSTQPLWMEWGGVSGAVIVGFACSIALGLDWFYSSLVAALLTILYFERRRYPKILITIEPHVTRVAFEGLRSTSIDIDEKSQSFLDGKSLELRAEGGRKLIVLSRRDFPAVDLDALWQWLTDTQQDHTTLARGRVAAIGGFRAIEGVSDLLSPREEQPSRRLLLIVWLVLLMSGMKWVFG